MECELQKTAANEVQLSTPVGLLAIYISGFVTH